MTIHLPSIYHPLTISLDGKWGRRRNISRCAVGIRIDRSDAGVRPEGFPPLRRILGKLEREMEEAADVALPPDVRERLRSRACRRSG